MRDGEPDERPTGNQPPGGAKGTDGFRVPETMEFECALEVCWVDGATTREVSVVSVPTRDVCSPKRPYP